MVRRSLEWARQHVRPPGPSLPRQTPSGPGPTGRRPRTDRAGSPGDGIYRARTALDALNVREDRR